MRKSLVSFSRDPEKYKRVMGVDSSSQGIAWAIIENEELIASGKIDLSKMKEFTHKMSFFTSEWETILEEYQPNYVYVEKSIFVKNPATARLLSYVVGSILTFTTYRGVEIDDVEPATWKAWLGYKNLSSKFVKEAKEALGATEGKKFCDKLRKSQTQRVIRHNYPSWEWEYDDHDISDAVGIALWAVNHVSHDVELEISKDISLNREELDRLGLKL